MIHTGIIHDFSDIAGAARADLGAIETLGATLAGSDRPFVVTLGTALLELGRLVTEDDAPYPTRPRHSVSRLNRRRHRWRHMEGACRWCGSPRRSTARATRLVPELINAARAKGASAYIGDGANRWPAVHRLDAARLFRLALESAPAGTTLHGVAEEGVPLRDIAAVIGRQLGVPIVSVSREEASDHFGWLARFAAIHSPASSTLTQERMGWRPVQPELIPDLAQGHYFTD